MLSMLGFEFGNKEAPPPTKSDPDIAKNITINSLSDCKHLLFFSEQALALGNMNEKDTIRENANVLCPEILGKTQSNNGLYIGAFTKDFIIVFRNIEGRLDQYYKILEEEVRTIWFSNSGRFLLVSVKKNQDNAFLVVDLELRSIVNLPIITLYNVK